MSRKVIIVISCILILLLCFTFITSAADQKVSFINIDSVRYRIGSTGTWTSIPRGPTGVAHYNPYDYAIDIQLAASTGGQDLTVEINTSDIPLFTIGSSALYTFSITCWLHLGKSIGAMDEYYTPSESYITFLGVDGTPLTSEFKNTTIRDEFIHDFEFLVESSIQYNVTGFRIRFPVPISGAASIDQVDFLNCTFDYTTSTEQITAAIDRGVDKLLTGEDLPHDFTGQQDSVNNLQGQEDDLLNNANSGLSGATDYFNEIPSQMLTLASSFSCMSQVIGLIFEKIPFIRFILIFSGCLGLFASVFGFISGLITRATNNESRSNRRERNGKDT